MFVTRIFIQCHFVVIQIISYGGIVCTPNLLLPGQDPVSCHLSLTPLVAAYENHSRKRPALVTDTFFAPRGCALTRSSTLFSLLNCTATGMHYG